MKQVECVVTFTVCVEHEDFTHGQIRNRLQSILEEMTRNEITHKGVTIPSGAAFDGLVNVDIIKD